MRLTVAQALVRFLAAQYTERDGVQQRLIAGCFGIFGHGNVAGIGQALLEAELAGEPELPYHLARNEQGMVHAAVGYARMHDRLSTLACTSSIGPGATNMVTGAALATINRLPVLLLPGDIFATRAAEPGAAGARGPALARRLGQRRLPARVALLRPHQPARAAAVRPARGDARADRPGRDRRRHARPPPGRPGRGLRLAGGAVRAARLARPPAAARARRAGRGRGAAARRPQAADRRRRRRRSTPSATDALRELAEATGIPVAETQAGKGSLPYDHPQAVGAIGATGTTAANALAREADVVLGVGTRWSDFTTASRTLFAEPGVRFVNLNVAPVDAHKQSALALVGRRARSASRRCTRRSRASAPTASTRAARTARARVGRHGRGAPTRPATARCPPSPRCSASSTASAARATSSSAPRAACPATCTSSGARATRRATTSSTATRAWATRSPAGWASRWPRPEREVFVMVGDGSYLMMAQELVTAVAEGIKLTVVLVQNHGFASIGALSESLGSQRFGTRYRFRDPGRARSTATSCRSTWPPTPPASAPTYALCPASRTSRPRCARPPPPSARPSWSSRPTRSPRRPARRRGGMSRSRRSPASRSHPRRARRLRREQANAEAVPEPQRESRDTPMSATAVRTIQHRIAGREVAGSSDRTAPVFDPATGAVQAEVALATAADVDAAVQAARTAFETWGDVSVTRRARVMFKFRDLVDRHIDDLARDHLLRARQGARRRQGRGHPRHGGRRVRLRHPAAAQGRVLRAGLDRHRRLLVPPAARRLRRDHAVQLPDHGPDVDAPDGDRHGQHVRAQALRARPVASRT